MLNKLLFSKDLDLGIVCDLVFCCSFIVDGADLSIKINKKTFLKRIFS
jgi:hypothetical protein